jgi:hypothetical protein
MSYSRNPRCMRISCACGFFEVVWAMTVEELVLKSHNGVLAHYLAVHKMQSAGRGDLV